MTIGGANGLDIADAGARDGPRGGDDPIAAVSGRGDGRGRAGVARDLIREGEAAKALISALGEIGKDDLLAADMIEGETGLFEAIDAALARLGELEAHDDGLEQYIKRLSARRERLGNQAASIRVSLLMAMDAAGLRKVERPAATLSITKQPPKSIVTNEADIPPDYWTRGEPKLDRKRLLADLKSGKDIPGATLSNQAETITIRSV